MTRTYDVKTVGYSEKCYRASIPRGREADTRAAEVLADYETKARKVDAEYNGWPYQRGGPPGPVLTLLRSLPPVTGLGVGSPASSRTELGSLSRQLVRRAFGRTSLRGVARIRQAALAPILG